VHVHELHTNCLTAVFRTYHNYTAHKTSIGLREVAPFFEVIVQFNSIQKLYLKMVTQEV